MATNGGTIKFNVGFNVDKSSLNQITKSLQEVQRAASSNKDMNLDTQFKQAASAAKQLQQIINSSWNDKLNQLNLDKFNQSINQSFGSVQNLKNQLVSGTAQGQAAFNSLASAVLNTNVQLRQSNTLLDKMAVSMANTVKWGITSKIFNSITGSIQSAYYYAKDLNSSLTDIRMVTGDSADEMERFAKNANEVSKALGRSTLDYTKSAVEYYRQGLSDEQVAKRTEITLKAQNITGAGKEMVDYLTAVWNGFKINTEQAEKAVDSLAKVADSSASNMSELATAMSKVSATANVVGVNFDQLNAMIATVVATTRLAPESVGTAFKTVFARINDIKTGAEDAQISLGNYSGRMASLGINVLDTAGRLRDTGDVITQVGQKWKTLTKQQQTYLASTMGGQRQITQVMALFDNWDKYVDLLNVSLEANGTLNEKNNIYLESTAAHLQQLSTEAQRTYATLFDADALNGFVDGLQGVLSLFNDFIEGLGGGVNAITYLGSVFVGVFSKQIAQSIVNVETRVKNLFASFNIDKFKQQYAQAVLQSSGSFVNSQDNAVEYRALEQRAQKQAELYAASLKARRGLNQQQQIELTNTQKQIGQLEQQKYLLENLTQLKRQYGYEDYSTTKQFQLQQKAQGRILSSLGQGLTLLRERKVLIEKGSTRTKEESDRLSQINQKLAQNNVYQEIHTKLRKEGLSGQQLLDQLIQRMNQAYQGTEKQLEVIVRLKELQNQAEHKTEEEIDAEIAKLGRVVQKYNNIGNNVNKTQLAVRGMSAAGQVLTSISGSLSTLMSDTATGAQKANAAFSGLQGTVMSVGTMFGPIGMGISALINGALSLLKNVIPGIDELFMSTQEKIAKIQQQVKKVNEAVQSKQQNIASLQAIQEQYNQLSKLAGKYGQNLDKMTQEEQNRYHELTNEFTQYNDAVILGYDAQGNAIVANQNALQDTIDLLKQQQEEQARTFLSDPAHSVASYNSTLLSARQQQQATGVGLASTFSQTLESMRNRLSGGLQGFGFDRSQLEALNTYSEQVEEAYNQLNGYIYNNTELTIDQINAALSTIQTAVDEADVQDSVLSAFLNDMSDYVDTLSDLQDKINYNNENLAEQMQFDSSFISTLLKWGDGYSRQYKQLAKSNLFTEDLNSLIYDFVSGFTFEEGLEEIDLNNKKASNYNQIIQAAQDYITNILNALTNSNDAISKALKQAEEKKIDIEQGTISERLINITSIIDEIISNLNTKDFQDKGQLLALQNVLAQTLGLDVLTLKIGQNGIEIDTAQIVPDQILMDAVQAINEKFNMSGLNESKKYKVGEDRSGQAIFQYHPTIQMEDIQDIFEDQDLQNISFTLSQIWSDVEANVDPELQNYKQALQIAYKNLLERRQQLEDLKNIDFDTAFTNFDTLVENLENKKALSDEEKDYLNLLESEDSRLKELAQTQGRGSQKYIEYLKQRQSLGQQIFIEEQKIRQQNARQTLAALEDTEENEGQRQVLEEEIAQALYNQAMAAEALAEKEQSLEEIEQKRKQLQQDILNLKKNQVQDDISSIKNTSTTLQHLGDSTATIEQADFATMLAWQSKFESLQELAGASGAGRFTQQYFDELQRLYETYGDQVLTSLYRDQTSTQLSLLDEQQAALATAREQYQQKFTEAQAAQSQFWGKHYYEYMFGDDQTKAELEKQAQALWVDVIQAWLAVEEAQQNVDNQAIAVAQSLGENENAARQDAAAAQKDAQALEKQAQALEKVHDAAQDATQSLWKMQHGQLVDQQSQTNSRLKQLQGIKDTIGRLKDSSKDVTSGDYSLIEYLKGQFPQLAALAVTEADIFGDTFISQMQKIADSSQFENLLSNAYDESLAYAQAVADSLGQEAERAAEAVEYIKEKYADWDLSPQNIQAQTDSEEAQKLKNALQELISAQEYADKTAQDYQKALDAVIETQYAQAQAAREATEQEKNLLETFQSLSDTITSAGYFGEVDRQKLQEWNDLLAQVLEKYPQLEDAITQLHYTEMSTTQQYQQALREVNHALRQMKEEELESQLEDIGQKISEHLYRDADNHIQIDVQSDLDQFMKQVQDYLDIERQIIINVHSDAEDTFDSLQKQMEQIYDASSKIGQNFVIAADDIKYLNDVFPGIIDGMQDLYDGTVQLSQDAVQQAIAGAKATVQANEASVNAQLQDQAKLLDAKAAMYRQAAAAAGRLAANEYASQEQAAIDRQTVFGAYIQDKEDQTQAMAQEQVDSAYDTASKVADATVQAAQAQATASDDAGKILSENMASAADSAVDNFAQVAENITENFSKEATASDQLGRIMAQNMASSAQSQSIAIAQLAQSAIQSFNAIARANQGAANGQVVSGGVGGSAYHYSYGGAGGGGISVGASRASISSKYSGSKGTITPPTISSQSSQISGAAAAAIAGGALGAVAGMRPDAQSALESALGQMDAQKYLDLQQMFLKNAASAQAAAESIRGMIAQNTVDLGNLQRELDEAAAGRPGSGKGSGGGGGGGGGQPDVMQGLQEEADRYHDIDIQLKRIANDLEKVQQLQEKLVGQKLIDNLQEQYQLLEDQVSAYKHKVELAQQERAQVGLTLAAQGVTFDENGAINNYAEALMSQESLVNEIITHYNYMSADQQEAYKDVVEQAKQQYEDFKAQIERYDQLTFEMIPELQKSIREERDKQIELQITKFTMKVQLELELAKAERDFNKFRKKVIQQLRDDDILGNAQANLVDLMSYYDKEGVVKTLSDQVNATLEQLEQIKNTGISEIYGQNQARALEDLKKYTDQLMSNMEQAEDIINDIKQAVFDTIDAAKDAFDEQVDDYEYLSKLLDHDVKLIKLLYGDDAYDSLSTYYQMQEQNNNKQLDFLRQEQSLWYQSMMMEQQRMNNLDKDSNDYKEAQDRFKVYKENWKKSTEELNSLVEKSVQNIIDKYANAIDSIFDKLNKGLTGGQSLQYVGQEWELINKRADMYLDKVDSLYEIEKLRDKYQQAINDYDGNLSAQKSLRDLMEEQLKFLQDKDKLTQYDVDRANALLQIELKRFALQNARNNKSKLRLRRDSQGNYTYQYTSDVEDINKAQQDLRQAQHDLYDLTKESYKNTLGDFYDYINEWQTKVKEVYKDTTLSVEEQQQKIALLNEYYGDIINGLIEQNEYLKIRMFEDTYISLASLYDTDAFRYKTLTEDEARMAQELFAELARQYGLDDQAFATLTSNEQQYIRIAYEYINGKYGDSKIAFEDMVKRQRDLILKEGDQTSLVVYWQSGVQRMINKFTGAGGFLPAVSNAFIALKNETINYQKSLSDLQTAAGKNFKNIKDGLDPLVTNTGTLLKDTKDLIQKWKDSINDITKFADTLGDVADAYGDIKEAAEKAATAAADYWKKQEQGAKAAADRAALQAQATTYTSNTPTYTPASAPASSGSSGSASSSTSGGGSYGAAAGAAATKTSNTYKSGKAFTYQVTNFNGYRRSNMTAADVYALNTKGWSGTITVTRSDGVVKYFTPGNVVPFDTGGYTGSWSGNSGKLGVLHQKELILNATDTQNILTAVDIVRDINNLLSGISAGSGLAGLVAGAASSSSLDQNVYITAEFPNVTQHTQIEKAFETLVNQASQFAFNTRR